MTTAEQEAQQRTDLVKIADKLRSLDLRDLYRVETMGSELSFKIGENLFGRALRIIGNTTDHTLMLIPPGNYPHISQFIQASGEIFTIIRTLTMKDLGNPKQERIDLLNRLERIADSFFNNAPAAAAILSAPPFDNSRLNEVLEQHSSTLAATTAVNKTINEKVKEVDALIAAAKNASRSVALSKYSSFFENEANSARGTATVWIVATSTIAILLIGFLIYLVFFWAKSLPDLTPVQALQAGSAKIALFTVLFFALSWCGRNFKAQWHICIVNRHRANSLNAIEAFANSSKSDANKEAIFVHACSAIFSQINTGFVPDQGDSPTTPSLLEIIRQKD